MSPPISPTVKERVIKLHLEGKGRNEIAQTLNLSHIRISQGSVTNILRTHKTNTASCQAPTKVTTDFLKAPEPSPSPSQLQTSSTSMKEEAHIAARQPLSIDAKGSEEPKGHDYSKETPSLVPGPEQGEAQPQIPIPVPAVPWSL